MAFLTKAQAQKQAERLAHHIRKYGVKVVIDLRPGAGGKHWGVDTWHGAMAHHIVSRRSQGLTPFYSLVRNGRSDVPGPLCNVYGGWDRVARIVTMGLANHPGKGGPWTVSGFRIPRDNGRYYFLGTEFEGGLREADWDDDYRRFMGAVNAGKLDYIRELRGSSVTVKDTALCEHSDWARPKGRKIDRLGYTQARGIAEMQAARRTSGVSPVTPTTSSGTFLERLLTMTTPDELVRDNWEFQNRKGAPSAWTLLDRAASRPSLQEIREAQSFHAGKIDEANQRNLRTLVAPQLENLTAALAKVAGGETFDEAKLLAGVQASAEQGARDGALAAEATLREALIEVLAEQPDRDANEVADAVVDKIAQRMTRED